MTDYEFKKALVKGLRELTAEVRALREDLVRTDKERAAISEAKEIEFPIKERLFKCSYCGFETTTISYEMGLDMIYGRKVPYILCPCCDHMPATEYGMQASDI